MKLHVPGIEEGAIDRLSRRCLLRRALAGAGLAVAGLSADHEVLPKHVTQEALKAVLKGLDYLAGCQSDDGSWINGGGEAYPVAMTGLAGMAFLRTATRRREASTPRTSRGRWSSWCGAARPTA